MHWDRPNYYSKKNEYILNTIGIVRFLFFNGISTFIGYLMPKPSSLKNSSGTI